MSSVIIRSDGCPFTRKFKSWRNFQECREELGGGRAKALHSWKEISFLCVFVTRKELCSDVGHENHCAFAELPAAEHWIWIQCADDAAEEERTWASPPTPVLGSPYHFSKDDPWILSPVIFRSSRISLEIPAIFLSPEAHITWTDPFKLMFTDVTSVKIRSHWLQCKNSNGP